MSSPLPRTPRTWSRLNVACALACALALGPATAALADDGAPPEDEESAAASTQPANREETDDADREKTPERTPEKTEEERELEKLIGPTYAESLVVTASRTEQSLLDAPVSVSVVGREQVETSPADNYGDLLRGVPGLNVVQLSARDINLTSRAAGSSLANSQLALVDGRSIYQDFFGLVMWDVLPFHLDEVQQVEVLRGPGSAVWGANAQTGVINVRTRSPRELTGGLVTLGGGEIGTRSVGARWAAAREKLSYRIAASWYEQDPWERRNTFADGSPIPESNEFDNEGTSQPKLDLRFDWDVEGDRHWSYRFGGGGTDGLLHTGIGPFNIDDQASMSYAEFRHERPGLDFKVYANRVDGSATNLLNLLPFEFLNTTWVAEATAVRQVSDRHRIVFGGNARWNDFDLSLAPSENLRLEAGAFAEGQLALSERVALNVGVRVDWFDTVGVAVSPRSSLVYYVRPRHSLRFAFNRAYRAPSLINNYLDTAVPNQYEVSGSPFPFFFVSFALGDPDLDVEFTDAFEIGYTAIFRNHTTFTAAIYRNVTTDDIALDAATYYSDADPPIGATFPIPDRELIKTYEYRNVGKVADHGIELSLNRRFRSGVNLTGSYTFQADTDIIEDDPDEPMVLNRPPRHQASVSMTFRRGRHSGSASASYQDRAFWTDVLDARFYGWTDSFVNLSAGYAVTFMDDRVKLKLNATNLANSEIKQHFFGDLIRRKVTAEVRVKF